MMIFKVILALFFYTFLFGFIFRLEKDEYSVGAFFSEVLPKSMFLSWAMVFISYMADLPDLFWILIGLTTAIVLYRNQKLTLGIESLSTALILIIFGIGIYNLAGQYELCFSEYDAVSSWNRWAIELASNNYNSMNSAYPILFPGIWSLIYKAQGDDTIWVFSKLTLLVVPILLFYTSLLYTKRNLWAGLILAALTTYFLFFKLAGPISNGYMDGPVSGFILASLIILLLALDNLDNEESDQSYFFLLASFIFGLAAVTKQAGFVTLALYCLCLIYLFVTKRITFKKCLLYGSISLIPLILFLIMFIPTPGLIFGNLEKLQTLSEQRTLGDKFNKGFAYVRDTLGPLFFYLLIGLSLLNFYFIKKLKSQLGVLILLISIAGFYLYQDCCSYSARNGWWITSMLIASSACALLNFKYIKPGYYLKFHFRPIYLTGLFVVIAAVCSFSLPEKQVRQIAEDESYKLIPGYFDLLKHLPKLGDKGVLISYYLPLSQHPQLRGKFAISFDNFVYMRPLANSLDFIDCEVEPGASSYGRNAKTLKEVMSCKPRSLVLLRNRHFENLKKNNPDFDYMVVDSTARLSLVWPILKAE